MKHCVGAGDARSTRQSAGSIILAKRETVSKIIKEMSEGVISCHAKK